jgi:hypothetical protein
MEGKDVRMDTGQPSTVQYNYGILLPVFQQGGSSKSYLNKHTVSDLKV